jgi:hypothetical protein
MRGLRQTFPPYVMDFDHVGLKTGEVSKFVYTYSTQRLVADDWSVRRRLRQLLSHQNPGPDHRATSAQKSEAVLG